MTILRILLAVALTTLGAIFSARANAPSVRIAVAGDPSLANLVDVTSTVLAQNPRLVVLDRATLDKLGQEQALQSVMSGKDFSPIQLLPTEGLVLLRTTTRDGKQGVFARLVAVQPGVVLREVALPDGQDPSLQAQSLAGEFARYWPKLSAIQMGKITALSLLGLRFEVDAPETREWERQINVLLASRLSSEPETLVLERWRLNDALFEKTLSQQSSPFWTGSSLIDGSMKWNRSGDRVDVILRVRPPSGSEVTVTDGDTPENLPSLVDRLAKRIGGRSSVPATWAPADEGRHFRELGKWCLDNNLIQEGEEATETAVALCDDSRTARMLRIRAYAMAAYPEGFDVFPSVGGELYPAMIKAITPDSLPERMQAAHTASKLAQDYLKDARNISVPMPEDEDSLNLSVHVLVNCVHLLATAYQEDFQKDHPETLAGLRQDVRSLIDLLDTRLIPDAFTLPGRVYISLRNTHAGLWHETPETTLAFYREVRSASGNVRRGLLGWAWARPPFLDDLENGHGQTRGWPLFGTPWIVSWDGRPASEMKKLWQNFLHELEASPDLLTQCDGIRFDLESLETDAARERCILHYADFIESYASEINSDPDAALYLLDPFYVYLRFDQPPSEPVAKRFSALFIDMLKRREKLSPYWIISATDFLEDRRVPPDQIHQLLDSLDAYTAWDQANSTPNSPVPQYLLDMRLQIFRTYPELKSVPSGDFLHVTRYWDSNPQATGPYQRFGVYSATFTVSENRIWFVASNLFAQDEILSVDPGTLQAGSSYAIPQEMGPYQTGTTMATFGQQCLDISPKWLALSLNDRVLLCSRSDNHWWKLDLPSFVYTPHFINQDLYLSYQPFISPGSAQYASEASGLTRVALPEMTTTQIISSRRIPPQTALDGTPFGGAINAWLSKRGLSVAVVKNYQLQAYSTPANANNWALLGASTHENFKFRLFNGRALLEDCGARSHLDMIKIRQLTLMDANDTKVLLTNPDYAGDYPNSKPLWNFPDEFRVKTVDGNADKISPVMRGDDLCLYALADSTTAGKGGSLFYFAHDQKNGVRIPLAFDFPKLKGEPQDSLKTPELHFEELQATDVGLVIFGGIGFWVVPWSDIDACRARLKGAE